MKNLNIAVVLLVATAVAALLVVCINVWAYPEISEPITGTVDRVSVMNNKVIGSHGGTYFSLEGDVDTTYACFNDTDPSCSTLAKGDRIEFNLTGDTRIHILKHVG